MRRLKRLVGVIIATVTMAVCLNLTAFATASSESASPTGTITLRNNMKESNVSIEGSTYYAYRLFDLKQNSDHSAYAYTLNDSFKGFFKDSAFTDAFPSANVDEDKTSTIYNFVDEIGGTATELEKFANVVYGYATTNSIAETATATGGSADKDKVETAVFDSLPLGYYLIYGDSKSVDAQKPVVTACILDTTTWDETQYALTIDLKVDVPVVEKKIVQNKDDENEKLVDAESAKLNDTVNFRVTSNVPDMTGYTAYTFKMTDTLSEGLTFKNDVVVRIAKTSSDGTVSYDTVANTNYTVTTTYPTKENDDSTETGETKFVVEFTDFYNFIKDNGYAAGSEILFDYSARVNDKAVIATKGDSTNKSNPNTVYITYSNNPHDETSTNDTAEDTVKVYSFKLDIFKYTTPEAVKGTATTTTATETTTATTEVEDKTTTVTSEPAEAVAEDETTTTTTAAATATKTTPLANAEFTVSQKVGNEITVLSFVEKSGVYRVATDDDTKASSTTTTTTVKSGDDGYIHIEGIEEGTYIIKEIKAPDGYNMLEDTITVSFAAKYANTELTELTKTSSATNIYDDYSGVLVNVLNETGNKLPSTGGMGTTIFYIVGGALIAFAVIVFTTRKIARRKSH